MSEWDETAPPASPEHMRGRAEGWHEGYDAALGDMVERNDRAVQTLREKIIRDLAEKVIVMLRGSE